MSDKEGIECPVIQDPIVPPDNYDVSSTSHEDDIIPGPPVKLQSLFEIIWEAPTGLPLEYRKETLVYLYNIVEKVYWPEYSPTKTNSRTRRYDIDMHVDGFLMDDKDNRKGLYHNSNGEQIIPRQLFAYIIFRTPRDGVSIQA